VPILYHAIYVAFPLVKVSINPYLWKRRIVSVVWDADRSFTYYGKHLKWTIPPDSKTPNFLKNAGTSVSFRLQKPICKVGLIIQPPLLLIEPQILNQRLLKICGTQPTNKTSCISI
jgi:hypothetical protein